MGFGENLKRIRKEQGITQSELAERVGMSRNGIAKYEKSSCDRTTIVKYENGENLGTFNRIASIARALNCTVGELFGEEPKVIYKDIPERVGRWEVLQLKELGEAWTVQCSECKAIGFHGKTSYCPECGARMQ